MDNIQHEKLTGIPNKSEALFGRKATSFEEVFPTIAEVRVEVDETKLMWPKDYRSWLMTERDFRRAVNCLNPVCHGGGVNLGSILHDITARKTTSYDDGYRGRGYEESPKWRCRNRSCLHVFRVTITIEYKADQSVAGDSK